MISDEERKRAVKFLRERECIKLDCHECYQMSEMVLGRQNALCAIDEQWGALADLIDRPTCRNLSPKPADVLLCSECGEHVDIAYVETCDEYHARYCPNCGRKVVTDE